MELTQETIQNSYHAMRRLHGMRVRDIAQHLNITEGQLIAAHLGDAEYETHTNQTSTSVSLSAIRLSEDWPSMLESCETLGCVMALTRNHACVHESIGHYKNISHRNGIGLIQGESIELRAFYRTWRFGFAVIESRQTSSCAAESVYDTTQYSLQFFDETGVAIHKVFLRPESDLQRYHQFVERFQHPIQTLGEFADAPSRPIPNHCVTEHVDVRAFHQAWRNLNDTHEFFDLLKRFSISRIAALRLAESDFVQPLQLGQIESLLHRAAEQKIPIMIFVGNQGMLQIHSGTVSRVVRSKAWLNVLDDQFNLHLFLDSVRTLWLVKKPTQNGYVTSIEAFDDQGELVVTFFGERELDSPELQTWRALTESLAMEAEACLH
ncbi:MAG: hemin-degrading factor [Betaproteobacteria bacterium]